jgi:hypothetical protein
MNYKRRVCVSIKKEKYKVADHITALYGFAPFVVACLTLWESGNKEFRKAIEEIMVKKHEQ